MAGDSVSWPPLDPDRILPQARSFDPVAAFTHQEQPLNDQETVQAFKDRQEQDLKRWSSDYNTAYRRRLFHDRYYEIDNKNQPNGVPRESSKSDIGEETWRNSEGKRLDNFNIDEEAEFYDEKNISLV